MNYAFVVGELLQLLYGDLHIHVNFVNAFFNCCSYDDSDSKSDRYIPTNGTNYGTYLSDMLNDKRNPTRELRKFLLKGEFMGHAYGKPNVTKFKRIIATEWHMDKDEEAPFRDRIRECIRTGDVSHLTKTQLKKIKHLIDHEEDFQTMVFYLVRYMILAGNNDFYKPRSDSDKTKTTIEAVQAIERMSTGLLALHENDNNIDDEEH